MRKKTRNVGKLLIQLGYVVAAWIVLSFIGVLTAEFAPWSVRAAVDSLFLSMVSGMIMGPAYLVMFTLEDSWPDEKRNTGVERFERTEGSFESAETFEDRTEIWNS